MRCLTWLTILASIHTTFASPVASNPSSNSPNGHDTKSTGYTDWRTFNGPDWWVTVVGSPSTDAAPALGWCDAHGLDADHCYAKIISSTRGVDGTTVLRN